MSGYAAVSPRLRGTELLLAHCALVERPSAAERLRAELGSELSDRLVAALSRQRPGDRRWRSSSSP